MNFTRKAFYILYVLIGRNLPPSTSKIQIGQRFFRSFLARGFCAFVGENVNIEDHATISADLRIGDNSGVGSHSKIMPNTVIGQNVMMGPNCFICTRNHRFNSIDVPMCKQGLSDFEPVFIEDDVWIGANVIILPGVTIGSGSILGAGAVITKSCPKRAIVVGNPAKIVRFRT